MNAELRDVCKIAAQKYGAKAVVMVVLHDTELDGPYKDSIEIVAAVSDKKADADIPQMLQKVADAVRAVEDKTKEAA